MICFSGFNGAIHHDPQDFHKMDHCLQLTIVPRMGEEKGAVRFKTDRTKFEMQSIRYRRPAV